MCWYNIQYPPDVGVENVKYCEGGQEWEDLGFVFNSTSRTDSLSESQVSAKHGEME